MQIIQNKYLIFILIFLSSFICQAAKECHFSPPKDYTYFKKVGADSVYMNSNKKTYLSISCSDQYADLETAKSVLQNEFATKVINNKILFVQKKIASFNFYSYLVFSKNKIQITFLPTANPLSEVEMENTARNIVL